MSGVEIDELLNELSPESPCGDNLEYDATFGELERAAQGKPEQQFGSTVIPEEEPDYREVKRLGLDLLRRTMDLRVAAALARALLQTDQFAGLRDGLALIRGYLERYWGPIHPQLDPDDDHDPTLRVNTLSSLCDMKGILLPLQRTPLVSSMKAGRFGLYDLAVAKGEVSAPADMPSPPTPELIEAAFLDAEPDELRATYRAVVAAAEHAGQIEVLITREVGASRAVSLAPLRDLLVDAEKVLHEQLSRRGLLEPAAEEEVEESTESGNEAPAPVTAPAPVSDGEVRSRQDVVRLLDRICEYYDQHEPSSPVPLLLLRAKRLASMSFLEVLRELAPDCVIPAETIGGVHREE